MTPEDTNTRIAKARAELEAIEKAREVRAAESAERARVEALELELADAKAIADAEEKLGVGMFRTVPTPLGVVVVKRPNHMHYRRFIETKDIKSDDAERLVLSSLVHPSRAAFQQIAEEYPAIPMIAAGVVIDLASGRKAEIAEKP